jgi:hypothetical protein
MDVEPPQQKVPNSSALANIDNQLETQVYNVNREQEQELWTVGCMLWGHTQDTGEVPLYDTTVE